MELKVHNIKGKETDKKIKLNKKHKHVLIMLQFIVIQKGIMPKAKSWVMRVLKRL